MNILSAGMLGGDVNAARLRRLIPQNGSARIIAKKVPASGATRM